MLIEPKAFHRKLMTWSLLLLYLIIFLTSSILVLKIITLLLKWNTYVNNIRLKKINEVIPFEHLLLLPFIILISISHFINKTRILSNCNNQTCTLLLHKYIIQFISFPIFNALYYF